MGSVCEKIMGGLNKQPPKVNRRSSTEEQLPDSNRRMSKKEIIQKEDKNQSVFGKSNLQIQSNSSVRETKIFMKNKSTALFSSINMEGRRPSSIIQFTLDIQSIIIRGSECELGNNTDQFYVLIDKVAVVKKTMDCIRVTGPDGQTELNCQPKHLFTTLNVSEGKPIECIQEVAPNKVIHIIDSPINVKLKLKCKKQKCKNLLKLSFCKGIITTSSIQCPKCEQKGNWSLQDIQSNAPIWGDGIKLDNNEHLKTAPSILRVMGCILCFKFSNCEAMECGCLLCKQCMSNDEVSLKMQCRMCQGKSYIL